LGSEGEASRESVEKSLLRGEAIAEFAKEGKVYRERIRVSHSVERNLSLPRKICAVELWNRERRGGTTGDEKISGLGEETGVNPDKLESA